MNYKRCKMVCGIMICSLMITSVTACGTAANDNSTATGTEVTSTSEGNTFTYTDSEEDAPVSTTVMAKVDSVSGNEVTLSVGGGAPGQPDGNAPGGDAPSGDASDNNGDNTPPEKPGESTASTESSDDASDKPADAPQKPDESSDSTESSGDASNKPADAPQKPDESSDSTESSGDASNKPADAPQKPDESSDSTEGSDDTSNKPDGNAPDGQPGGNASGVDSYDAATEYTKDTTAENESYSSTGTDENAILVSNGATVNLKNSTIDRTSSDSTGGDNSSFYGVGAAVLTTDGTTCLSNANITTDAAGGAGVFAYGDGTVYVADSDITTKQDTSGGIHAAGGGTLYAWDLNVETDGESAAAIRSDRGGGTMVVNGGSYTSNGTGSPAVYCTADIAVNNAALTATGSEAICMEGLNTIHLFDCDISGNMQDLSQNDTTWTIIVYQSMSGDSEVGNSTMQIVGGSLTSKNGGLIYTTNTEADILLSDVDITYSDDSEFFLMCTGNTNERGWGTAGANGSDCTFTADDQDMQGGILWDSISQLDFYMTNGSTLTGYFADDETYAGDGGDGYCNVVISKDSTWTVTGDSTITSLSNEGTIVDESGNTVSVVGTDGTVYVEGTGSYTITVDSYNDSADLSGAATADSWSNHEVAKPESM